MFVQTAAVNIASYARMACHGYDLNTTHGLTQQYPSKPIKLRMIYHTFTSLNRSWYSFASAACI